MVPYSAAHVAAGGRLGNVTRHMLGLFSRQPGARAWRQALSVTAARPDAGATVMADALEAVRNAAGALAEAA